jgi:hypothetical protein
VALRRRDVVSVVRFDGNQINLIEVKESAAGVLRSVAAPHYEFSADVCTLLGPGLYGVAMDEVVLRSETDFHRSRRRIATSALFENNSDVMELARNIAFGVVLVVSLLVWFQVGHIAGALDAVTKAVIK